MEMKAFALRVLIALGWVHNPDDEDLGQPQPAAARDHHNLDWPKILAVFCAASSIAMALVSAQNHTQLPAIFCFLGLTIIMSFTCIFVSKCIHLNYPLAAHVLQQLGVFFGVTAIFVAITIPYPSWFKCLTCFIYVLCWLTILLCNLHPSLLP